MRLHTKIQAESGELTNGEAATLVARITDVNAEDIEGFAVICIIHNNKHDHQLIINSNITHRPDVLRGMLVYAFNTISGDENETTHEIRWFPSWVYSILRAPHVLRHHNRSRD